MTSTTAKKRTSFNSRIFLWFSLLVMVTPLSLQSLDRLGDLDGAPQIVQDVARTDVGELVWDLLRGTGDLTDRAGGTFAR